MGQAMTTPERDAERARQLLSRHLYRRTSEGPIFDQGLVDDLTLAFAAVREEEREACARIASAPPKGEWPWPLTIGEHSELLATAIRSRTRSTEEG